MNKSVTQNKAIQEDKGQIKTRLSCKGNSEEAIHAFSALLHSPPAYYGKGVFFNTSGNLAKGVL